MKMVKEKVSVSSLMLDTGNEMKTLNQRSIIDQIQLNRESTLETPSKDKAMEEQLFSCPTIQFVPSHVKTETEYHQSALFEICPSVTKIAGMPSKLPVKEKHWLINPKPIWEKQSKTNVIFRPNASKDDTKNTKGMMLMLPSCPREAKNPGFPSAPQNSLVFHGPNMEDTYPEDSCIPVIPSIPQPTIAHHRSDMMSLLSSCPKTSCIEGVPSLKEHLSKTWATDHKPLVERYSKMNTAMIEERPYNEDLRAMSALAPTCPKAASIPGFPSARGPTVSYKGFSRVNLLPSCPATSSMAGFPSIQNADSKDWNTVYLPLWEKQMKQDSVLLLDDKRDKDMKGVVCLVQSCPRESLIPGFPSVPKPRMIDVVDMTNMVSLLSSCSQVSQITEFPSSHTSKDWIVSRKPVFEPGLKEKQVLLIDKCDVQKKSMKEMVSLVPSCPREAQVPGFPSNPNYGTVYNEPNIISLFTLCSQASKIPGFSSVNVDMSVGWVAEKGSLLKRLPKKRVIFDTPNESRKIMKNMVLCVPSCPKVSSIPGFPSIPNPKMVYYGLNEVNLLPLCPQVSSIPGFPSVEDHKEEGWGAELGSLMQRAQKNIQRINISPIHVDKPNNMYAMVPSCPVTSKIPGFPSFSQYNMLSLVPICNRVSNLPGFASFVGASKLQWPPNPHALCDKPPKNPVFVMHSPNQDGVTAKTMFALAPSCPEASRIPGFPSAPQTKSKMEPNMISCVLSCSSASSLKGFASITTQPNTGWLTETKPILIKLWEKRAPMMMMSLAGQDELNSYNMKAMVTLVTSCPKEARACGFPSAQVANIPPNMVSLYTSAPCVSCIPGFPSARTLSYLQFTNIQTKTTHSKPLFEKLQKEKQLVIAKSQSKENNQPDESKNMVAIVPSCPHLTRIPGLPSISQLNPTEKETMTMPVPCCTEMVTSHELPNGQSTQSHLKDPRTAGVPSTSFNLPSTELADEEKFKGSAKQSIDLCVENGKSHIERIVAEKSQTRKRTLDPSVPAGVLDWEVLEAEETVTKKQTQSSLSAKKEESSGIVNVIAGVFHKGYETVASILGPSSSALAEVEHQPKAVFSMDLRDKTVTPSDEFSTHSVDNTTALQKIENQFEDVPPQHNTEYLTIAEPYMLDLALGDQSASPSPPTSESDEGISVCVNMKKWPPLTEADISNISKEDVC
ncbi:uncharacterized protein LOC134875769 isoform X2 [Eleginops maclovinus]|uniref:uncharacterized protein LOC134875769 isoform X2 n=1 Tax=Eleginops maclovinus TaxID=56733 RepID=UPI00308072C1